MGKLNKSKLDKKINVIDLLKNYNGKNPYIKEIKYKFNTIRNYKFTDFDIDYILKFHNTEPKKIGKVFEITDWYAKTLQQKWNIDFEPKNIIIGWLLAEFDGSYHCYVKYFTEQEKPIHCFIPKKALFGALNIPEWKNKEIDFTMFDQILEKHGRKVLEHQKEGARFLTSINKNILALDMGLAKTYTSIMASIISNFERVLIISPANLKTNWKHEFSYFYDNVDDYVDVVNNKEWKSGKKFTIINYDILDNFYEMPMVQDVEIIIDKETGKKITKPKFKKVRDPITKKITLKPVYKKSKKKIDLVKTLENSALLENKYDLVIIDEIHKLSNTTSMTYKIVNDFIKMSKIKHVWGLTGTPLTNKPMNLYNILKLINADITQDWEYFMTRFCGGKKFTRKDNGKTFWVEAKEPTNLDELAKKIEGLYLRRTKDEIPGMPQKQIIQNYYELSEEQNKIYDQLWDEYESFQKEEFKRRLELGELTEDEELKGKKELIEGGLLRKFIATNMIDNTIDLCNKHLENNEKVIIAVSYDEEWQKLKEYYGESCVVYHGKMTPKAKDKAKEEFMNNPKIKVFIGNINAAGVGLTLTAASVCIFNSYDWVPGNNSQMMDRIARLGQVKDTVLIYFLLFTNTISEHIWKTVVRKQIVSNSVIKTEQEKCQRN